MTRSRAWFLAAVVTVSLVALVVGIGATFGQFGFRNGDNPVSAEPRGAQDSRLPSSFPSEEDEYDDEDEEHEGDRDDDEDGEHERDEHEDEEHEDEEHEDDD